MRKTIALGVVFFLTLSITAFYSCNNNFSGTPADSQQDSLKQVIARGKYLAIHVAACIHCHSHRDFTKYSGPVILGSEGGGGDRFDSSILNAIPGVIHAANITPDSATGIGTWTDAEVLRAITQGINKKGDTLFPIMPYAKFNHMAKSDVMDIIAYIRTLKPISNKIPARQLFIPISMAYPAAALQKTIDNNVRPAQGDTVKYGAYLTTMAGCAGCHTPFVKGQADFARIFAGGNRFNVGTFAVAAANITPDTPTGIGAWDESAFLDKFTLCREEKAYNYNPGKTNTVMPLTDYSGMSDTDIKAIYAFLRTVKPVKNQVVKYPE